MNDYGGFWKPKGLVSFYCIADKCTRHLEMSVEDAHEWSAVDFNRNLGWFMSDNWHGFTSGGEWDQEWDGNIFCPDHEIDALELISDGD